jgi:NADH:quinone reductase (non-electrogenic)
MAAAPGAGTSPRRSWPGERLALGAEGINMGTRFCATVEAPNHANVKQKYVENDERGSHLIFRSFHNTARVGKSDVSDEVVRRLNNPNATFEDVRELVSGVAGKQLLETGDMSKCVFRAGMVQGLIHDIPTCRQLIDRIIADAEAILDDRLASMRRPGPAAARVA